MQNLLELLIHHDGTAINFKLLTGRNAVHSESPQSSCPKLLLWGVHSVSEYINQFTNITVACLLTTDLWLLFLLKKYPLFPGQMQMETAIQHVMQPLAYLVSMLKLVQCLARRSTEGIKSTEIE